MTDFYDNRSSRTATYIRPGGPGNKWKLADPNGTMVDAPSGGGVGLESRFGLNSKGQRVYQGAVEQGDPERFETTLQRKLDNDRAIEQIKKLRCRFDIAVYSRCGDIGVQNYKNAIMFYDGGVTSKTYSDPLAQLNEETTADMMYGTDVSFSPIEEIRGKLKHDDITGTVSDFDFNKVISVGFPSCPDNCGVSENDGAQDFWAVTDADSTPGYLSQPTPMFVYTQDGGGTWTAVYIDVFTNGQATDVIKLGEFVVVSSPTNGIAYAKFQDILDGVSNPWALATGFSGISSPNYPRVLFAVSSSEAWAASANGRIWQSTDAGLSWTLKNDGVTTTNQINSISFVSDTLGYFAGNSGALVKYYKGAFSLLSVSDGTTTVSANLNVVETVEGRTDEVYVGTQGGQIWRNNEQGKANKWSNKAFELSGSGSIKDLKFAGFQGDVLFIIQNDANGNSRVLRDISGGALGEQVEVVGSFTQPSNFGIVSIAPANINTAVTVGNIHATYGFIGKVSA